MRPRVGISRCLLGDSVRYDGGHKLEPGLVDALGPHVEWVEVCPEVEVGMGVPRAPVHLVAIGRSDGSAVVRMIESRSGHDWTEQMTAWGRARIRELASMKLAGYILKAQSPSCGLDDATIARDAAPDTRGRGLFAAALVAALPDLPVVDEEVLRDPAAVQAFLDRVRAFHGSRCETL